MVDTSPFTPVWMESHELELFTACVYQASPGDEELRKLGALSNLVMTVIDCHDVQFLEKPPHRISAVIHTHWPEIVNI